ncbi:MAG: hypothetical protein V4456_07660 [Bacteroidota bacterium]
MKVSKYLIPMAIAYVLISCGHRSEGYQHVGDSDLAFQVLPGSKGATGSTRGTYLFRIIPSAARYEALSAHLRDSLVLHMDSSFHAEIHGRTISPLYVQNIPNGIKGTFEFMADFDLNKAETGDTLQIIYQDKYINEKKYRVKTVVK